MIDPRFDDMRPYTDEEIPSAMKRMVASPVFPVVASYLFPERPVEETAKIVSEITTIDSFQVNFVKQAIESVVSQTISKLTCTGAEALDPQKSYLFVSNHRDIVLDATLLSYCLHFEGISTPQITFGANLMQGDLVVDFGKSNRMFKVERPSTTASAREFYEKSILLSDYIRYTITQSHESVWIAQRNGRTKNGFDSTDVGLLKMFEMSKRDNLVASLSELNIVPIAVSYEWEPCDVLKAMELLESLTKAYEKKPGEDLKSIITGITKPKGNVSIAVCKPLTEADLTPFKDESVNVFNSHVAELLDRRICSAYALTPNNYIAYDLRSDSQRFVSEYSDSQKDAFLKHLESFKSLDIADPEGLKSIVLDMYANPVERKMFFAV